MRTAIFPLPRLLPFLAMLAATLLLVAGWMYLWLIAAFGGFAEQVWTQYLAWLLLGPFLLASQLLPPTGALVAGLLIVGAARGSVVLLVVALMRRKGPERRQLLVRAGAGALALALLVWGSFDIAQTRNHLGVLPEGLQVKRVLYAREQVWGFGPGGNETGVIAYALPSGVAQQVAAGGSAFLASMPASPREHPGDWRSSFQDWQPTPLPAAHPWTAREPSCLAPGDADCRPRLRMYLEQHGFPIEVDAGIAGEIDAAVANAGSFYAYGRYGMVLVVPARQRVYYLYAG